MLFQDPILALQEARTLVGEREKQAVADRLARSIRASYSSMCARVWSAAGEARIGLGERMRGRGAPLDGPAGR